MPKEIDEAYIPLPKNERIITIFEEALSELASIINEIDQSQNPEIENPSHKKLTIEPPEKSQA